MLLKNVKKNNNNRKRDNKHSTSNKERTFSRHGYKITPSFISTGAGGHKRVARIVQLVVDYPMNRYQTFGWFTALIPKITVPNVKARLIDSSKPVSVDEQFQMINETSVAIGKGAKYSSGKNEKSNEVKARAARRFDVKHLQQIDGEGELLIDEKITILLTASNEDDIDRQLEKIEEVYHDQYLNGISFDSVAGDQRRKFKHLLDKPDGRATEQSLMSRDITGHSHAVRRGLNDRRGWPIGKLRHSFSSSEAFFDFEKTLDTQAIIAAPTSSQIVDYDNDKKRNISAASLWSQLAANQIIANGHKVINIVLNGFSYKSDDPLYLVTNEMDEIVQYVDLSLGGINPVELLASEKQLTENPKRVARDVFTETKNKLNQIFYLLSDREMNDTKKSMLGTAIHNFYIKQGLWEDQASERTERLAGHINVIDKKTVPTLGTLLADFTNYAESANTDSKVDAVDALQATLDDALNTYDDLFNKTTTLPEKDDSKLMYYYDLSKLRKDPNIQEAQFINTFVFATKEAEYDDVVIIHGINQISHETLQMIQNQISALRENGVRIIFALDTIGSDTGLKKDVPLINIFNMKDLIYSDFENDFNFSILGSMTHGEAEEYESIVKQKISKQIFDGLQENNKYQYQVRRPGDATSNFVRADFAI